MPAAPPRSSSQGDTMRHGKPERVDPTAWYNLWVCADCHRGDSAHPARWRVLREGREVRLCDACAKRKPKTHA